MPSSVYRTDAVLQGTFSTLNRSPWPSLYRPGDRKPRTRRRSYVIRLLRRQRAATTANRIIIRPRHTAYTSSGRRRRNDARTPLPPVVVVRLRGVATLRGRSTRRRPVPGHVVREVQRGKSARALHAG